MVPVKFVESNRDLAAPSGMPNCKSLPVHTDGRQCVSCWSASWKERLSILFFGKVWLYVVSGRTQPPVCIDGCKTVFEQQEERDACPIPTP